MTMLLLLLFKIHEILKKNILIYYKMSGTYLSSKATLDELLSNAKFIYRAKLLVNSSKGTTEYLTAYRALDNVLRELQITEQDRVNIIKSDGGYWYSNLTTPEETAVVENHNTRPEIFSAVNYAFGNPICNKKIYPLDLQSSISDGYGFAERKSSTVGNIEQYVAYTYKPTDSPLSNNVFTVRVAQSTSQ